MISELKTAAAYIRVSTADQTELSPDSQIKVVQTYAKQHGFIIPKEFIYRDDGISGRHADKRPGFNEMIAASKRQPAPFCAVLLWKFSRFARNQEESIFYKSMLRKNGIEVISVSEPAVDGPFGTLIERIIEWSDEYYSIRLSGEVKRGMTEKAERGGAVSVPSYGYNIIDGKYVADPETAPVVKKIFSDYLGGVPLKRIANQLNAAGLKTTRGNPWENRTVEYILYNPVYIGKIRWNPKRRTRRNYDDPDIMITDGSHEPIIDEETFNKAQKQLAETKKRYSKYEHAEAPAHDYMLRSLVKCSNCGGSLTVVNRGVSLQCCKYNHGKCSLSHSVSLPRINTLVLDTLEAVFNSGDINLSVKTTAKNTPEIDYPALIRKEQAKYKRIKEAYEDSIYTLDEFKESKKIIEARIKELQALSNPPLPDMEKLKRDFIKKNKDILPMLRNPETPEKEKNEALKSFVEKIIFNRTTNSIVIFFYE